MFRGLLPVPPGEWKVFWFNNDEPMGREMCAADVVFQSGILGINVEYNDQRRLSKAIVKRTFMKLANVCEWEEVRGPDSLELK